jgi:uncharacterized membrane protein YebE (DUF533 family)
MFKNIFGPASQPAAEKTERAFTDATAGETETVRRIVGRLESMPPERARLVASAAYILARAANADMNITDEETQLIEQQLQERGMLDEPTAVLVAEMARLQARTVGDTEDYVVTREFKAITTPEQRRSMLRACFMIGASNGTITADEASVINQIARELDLDQDTVNEVRAEYHELLSSVQAVRRVAGTDQAS